MIGNFMNPPEPSNGQAYTQKDYKTGVLWICCPHCGKRQFPLSDGARIENQEFQCKGSNCKKKYIVNVGGRKND